MARDLQDAHRAATMYYIHNETMEVIGATLGVSRSTVSRLLTTAREAGMVQINVRSPFHLGQGLANDVSSMYGVRAHVVPVRQRSSEAQRLEHVAAVAARHLSEWFTSGMSLGVGWGTTMAAVARHLVPQPKHDTAVVQLNGSANTETTGLAYATDLLAQIASAFDSIPYYFPVPAFFDFEATKKMMWQERSIQRVHERQRGIDIAIFGVGGVASRLPSHVYSGGYLDDDDMAELQREQVVGDVCTVFLRRDGSYRDIALNARASGPPPHELRRIERRVCVAVGETKVEAIIGALRAEVATDLVIDEVTAQALLRRDNG